MQNKKGAIPAVLTDFAGYGAFIVVLLVFFILFGVTGEPKTNKVIETDFAALTGQQFLSNYLQTPVYLTDSEQITMADYIVIMYEKEEIKELEKEIKKDFDNFIDNSILQCYSFELTDGKNAISFHVNPKEVNFYCCSYLTVPAVTIPKTKESLITSKLCISKVKSPYGGKNE